MNCKENLMAIIKSISPKIKTQTHLTEALSYITQDKKASDVYYHRCAKRNSVAQLAKSFEQNRIAFDQNTGRLAVHICQSFSPDDNVTPEAAHEIGIELINRCFPDYQVVMATHNDRDHLHNHFIINSVSFLDKKKLPDNMKMINQVRKVSDELCYLHNLSVIEKENAAKYSPLDQATLNAAKQGRSWKFNLVKDLDAALDSCKTKSEFIRFFESKNYEIKFTPQNITFRKIGNKKGIRADTLAKQFGRKYSKSSIEKKLNIAVPTANPKQQQNQQQRFQIPNYDYYNQLAAVNWKRYEKKYAERINVPKRIYANPNLFARNPFVFTLRLIRFICNLKGNKPKQKIKSYSTVYKTYSYVDYKTGKKIIGNIPYKTIVNTFGEAVQIKLYAWQISRLLNNSILLSSRVDLKTGTGMTTIKKTDLPRVAAVLGVPTESFVKQAELIRNRKITAELKRHNLNLCYLRVNSDQVTTLRERCVTFACYPKGDNFNIAFVPEDKDRVLDILYPDRGKQDNREDTFFKRNAAINRAIKSKAKETGEKICYKVVFANQYKQLRNTALEFAVFRTKDGKYNVVFLESQKQAIEAALRGNAPTAHNRKIKL